LVVAVLRSGLRSARPELRHGVAVGCLLAFVTAPFVLFAIVYRPDEAAGLPVVVPPRIAHPAEPSAPQNGSELAIEVRQSNAERAATRSADSVGSPFGSLVTYLPGVWLAGSLLTLALLATGLVGVERLRRASVLLVTGPTRERCRVLARSLGIGREVGVAICDRLVAPVLIGVLRPMILLPTAALSGWSADLVEMALLHELAHIRRRDNLVMLVQRLAESLLFFHPVTWWLSAWISLEREVCCDRLVVARTGRPQAYAHMLAGLAGAGLGETIPALAMAERPLTARIRRILDKEDRSMKLTLTEGLGLLVAAIAGTALTLAAHAAPPPKPVPNDVARRTLAKLVEDVVAHPESQDEHQSKDLTLLHIAQAQLKINDRAGTLATLQRLDARPQPAPLKLGSKSDALAWQRFGVFAESIEVRRQAGDLDGARRTLARAARQLGVVDDGVIRTAFARVSNDMDRQFAKQPEGTRVLDDEDAAFVCEASAFLIEPCIAMGDHALARALIHRLVDAVGPTKGLAKSMFVEALGSYLVKAGDPEGGRKLIRQASQAAHALTDPPVKAAALGYHARSLAEAGDIDGALALVRELTPATQEATLTRILEKFTVDDHRVGWVDPAGINLKIGDPSLTPKDPAACRAVLPKVAAAARATGDARVEARTLATVALLQARSRGFREALETAQSIPDLKRADFPGPSDGFYEAVKPATFALIAGIISESHRKDRDVPVYFRANATSALAHAVVLAGAIGADDQKLIAQIVIAQQHAERGNLKAAQAVATDALALALTQAEPRRSRVLTVLAEVLVKAGDNAAALRLVDAIRDYPGLEKARALTALAQRYEESGDKATSEAMARRAIACLEAKPPRSPLPGRVGTYRAFGRDTFIDFDLEFDPQFIEHQRANRLQALRIRVGDVDTVVRSLNALPPQRRQFGMSQVIGDLVHRGDVAAAMELAASIEAPDARLSAVSALANAIPGISATK
jgi:beta-lactamase regulating signal transducer with metallopeptidase domain